MEIPLPLSRGADDTYASELPHLFNLWRVLAKLFMDLSFAAEDFSLSRLEQSILAHLLRQKGFCAARPVELSRDCFDRLRKANLRKKKEDCLKFIFKKALRWLKTDFLRAQAGSERIPERDIFPGLYEWYFGRVARDYGIPLESFFHFRKRPGAGARRVPKSITKKYIGRLKLNPRFVADFAHFLDAEFLGFFVQFNMKKIKGLVAKWERTLARLGLQSGAQRVLQTVRTRGNKFPWTLNEALFAREVTLERLGLV